MSLLTRKRGGWGGGSALCTDRLPEASDLGQRAPWRPEARALYLECCRAKVHFLYVAYSRRMERSICLHMATVIWICGSLSPVGHWCSRLMILQKADLSETLKVPVHLGG